MTVRDDDDDHDEHDDGEGDDAPMSPEDVLEALEAAIERRELVQVTRAGLREEAWVGTPLAVSERLLLVRSLREFAFDGFAVMRLEDVTAVRAGEAEAFVARVLEAEGMLRALPSPKPLPLGSMRALLEGVRAHYRHAIVECEEADEERFYLGELGSVDGAVLELHYIQVNGTREREATRVPLDEVTLVRFAEQYVSLYGRYALAEGVH